VSTWHLLCSGAIAGELARRHLTADAVGQFWEETLGTGGSVLVISTEDAAAIAGGIPASASVERRVKHAKKPLTGCLPARTRLVIVRARYREPGQAERGVRALAGSARFRSWGGVAVVEIDPVLFKTLWTRAGAAAVASVMPSAGATSGEATPLRLLLDTRYAPVPIPEVVTRTYVGRSEDADWVRRRIVLASRGTDPVLIVGETGTGKEVVARLIHELQHGPSARFVAVNCGGIPESLFESELFGHVRGAFTGAIRDKAGLWEFARGGTIFLDEIADMSPDHQVKVLRAIEDGVFRPVGGHQEIRSNARVIAATNQDLAARVCAHRFREDLYYRLLSFPIATVALREHPEDIPLLADHFWRGIRGSSSARLPQEVLDLLQRFPWPGNARELRSLLSNVHTYSGGAAPDVDLVRAVFRERTSFGRASRTTSS
jgi:hypothetical protein